MIPKIIHYCWFGNGKIPDADLIRIEEWKRICPDFKIVLWNEDNFDIKINSYMYDAYIQRKWGFVPDFARLYIVYNFGGVYLDTDVQIIKPINKLLDNQAFFGFESRNFVNLGHGFGAEPKNPVLKLMLEDYEQLNFINIDGSLNLTPSPHYQTEILKKLGLRCNGSLQKIMGATIYPEDYFNPKDFKTGRINITQNTYSIHHFNMSWQSDEKKKLKRYQQWCNRYFGKWADYIFLVTSIPFRFKISVKEKGIAITLNNITARIFSSIKRIFKLQ